MLLTNAGFEELAAYPLVHTDGFGYFLHVGSGGLAESADAVDAADPLSQEGVGCLHAQQQERFNAPNMEALGRLLQVS